MKYTHICYSNFYIKDNGQYITVYQAYEQNLYTEKELITLAQSMDIGNVFISQLRPNEVTLGDLSTDITNLGN